jgi:hypothetical protein
MNVPKFNGRVAVPVAIPYLESVRPSLQIAFKPQAVGTFQFRMPRVRTDVEGKPHEGVGRPVLDDQYVPMGVL